MDKYEERLGQLKDSSGVMKPNLHILDEIVPIEVQMQYFQYAKHVQGDKVHLNLDRNYLIARLFTPEIDIEDKRYYLSVLAGLVDIAAYRAIETYHSSPLEPELANWSAMALVESKVLLDADLSGEKQFFVSTGLGGHGGMLRFFSVITSSDREAFTELQKDILVRELRFAFEHDKIELEEITIKNNYVRILLLCGLNNDARITVDRAIKESNELGGFVDTRFILTNIKKIEDSDIENMLKSKGGSDKNKNIIILHSNKLNSL